MTDGSYEERKRIWFELLELDATARAARLDALAVASPALAAELREQWNASGRTVPLLDRCDAAGSAPELPGYRILGEIGRGGMGRVWLAERQLGDAVQRVAVKQIADSGWDAGDRRRFERERRILASLHHPHIAALLDGGSDARGAPWLAVAYVDGERLDEYVRAADLPLEARVRLLVKVAAAVAHAHRQLVVHRDLKPANILVEAGDEPRLLDFGIARLVDDDATTATGTGQMTLRYAAPEQVRGSDRDSGVASDIHALGVLLYELIAGAAPHEDVRDPAALVNAVLTRDPPPPSGLGGRRRSAAGADLDAIALKALRKRPEDRYATADAFAADLERWLAQEPVEARRGERGYHARAFVRRRWPALAVSVAVLATTIGFVVYDGLRTRQQLAAVAVERDKAQALAGYLGDLFTGARPSEVERGDVSAAELLERSVDNLREDSGRPPATRAALLVAASNAQGALGQYREALATADLALGILGENPAPDPATLAAAWTERASSQARLGENDAARADIAQAAALLGRVDDPALAIIVRQQQAIYDEEAGNADRAVAVYRDIIDRTADRLDVPRMLESHVGAQFNLALVEMHADPAAGEQRLREALRILDQRPRVDPSMAIKIKSALALTLVNQHRLAEARPLHAQALREAREWFTRDSPWLDVIAYHYATLALLDGRSTEAIRLLDQAIEQPEAARAHGGKLAWRMRSLRATASLAAGEYADAASRLREVMDWREKAGQEDSAPAAFERLQLAYARCRKEPRAESLAELRHAAAAWTSPPTWQGWYAEAFVPDCEAAVPRGIDAP